MKSKANQNNLYAGCRGLNTTSETSPALFISKYLQPQSTPLFSEIVTVILHKMCYNERINNIESNLEVYNN